MIIDKSKIPPVPAVDETQSGEQTPANTEQVPYKNVHEPIVPFELEKINTWKLQAMASPQSKPSAKKMKRKRIPLAPRT